MKVYDFYKNICSLIYKIEDGECSGDNTTQEEYDALETIAGIISGLNIGIADTEMEETFKNII